MSKRVNHITELIGNTPLVKLNRLTDADSADIYVKVEAFNAGGSVKDRIALNIIETAEREGKPKTRRYDYRSNFWKYWCRLIPSWSS